MNFKMLAARYAGKYADTYGSKFESLKNPLEKSGMKILFRTYVAMMLFYPFVAFIVSFPLAALASLLIGLGPIQTVGTAVFVSLGAGIMTFVIFYMTPAQKAGIKEQDIITKIDGKKVSGEDESSLAVAVAARKVGDRVEVEFWRDGGTKKVTVTLEEAK